MTLFLAIFFLFLMSSGVEAKTCPDDRYLVRGHSRQAYYKNDGTYVSSTTVSPYCRFLAKIHVYVSYS